MASARPSLYLLNKALSQAKLCDYYVAQGTDASCYWICHERGGEMQWLLHGLFG